MRRAQFYGLAKKSVFASPRIPKWRKVVHRRAIEHITQCVVASWPSVSDNQEQRSVREQLSDDYGYSSIWLTLIGSLISIIIQILLANFRNDEDKQLIVQD